MHLHWPRRPKKPLTIFLLIVFCTIQSHSVAGQACSSSDLSESDFVYGYDNPLRINAQSTGVLAEFPMINTIAVESTSIGQMSRKYIDAEFDPATNSLRIIATAALVDYELEQYSEQITLTIEMSCTGNTRRRLVFKQLLDDSNNHDPVFAQSVYTIELALPLPRGFDLTFYQEISARDLDIRNNQVTFSSSIDNSVVTVETANRVGDDQKTFYASLKTSQQLLTLTEPMEFYIIGTDKGTPSRSGRATIILKANPDEAYVSIPVFESAIYRGSLNTDRELTLAQPVIKSSTFNSEIAFGFSGGDSSLFTHTNVENVITIALRNPLTEADLQNRAVLMTTLVANRANVDPGSTVILVDIPMTTTPVPFEAPAFEKELYVGSLNVDQELVLEQLVITTETYDSSVTLTLEGENAALFDVTNEGNLISVKLLNKLSPSDIESVSLFTARVRASRENVGSGVASFVVTTGTTTPAPLPVVPRFERTFYEASISKDNQLTFEVPTIVADTYTNDVVLELEGDGASWFRVTNTANEVTIQLDHILVAADLTRSFLIVRLWARHPTDGSGSTELIVTLPSLLTSSFNLGVTVGSIDVNRDLQVPQITLDPASYTTDMQFNLDGADAVFFTINNVENVITITLASPLSEDAVKDRSYFRTEVTASNALNFRVGISVLIVDIVKPAVIPSPKFTLPAFRGSLDLDLVLTVEDVLLEEATYGEDVVFSLEGGDEALFTTTNTLNKVEVTLRQPLAESDIVDRTYLMTVLRAERPSFDPTATVLLINIPVTTPRPTLIQPEFSKPLYRGSVREETGLEIEEVQLVLSTYSDAVSFELSGDDSKLFDVTNVLNIVTIRLLDSVTESQLEDYEFLTFEVVAKHPEANLARAGILISVPTKECPIDQTPTFENRLNVIHIKDTATGVIGRLTAAVALDESAKLEYRLADHDYLASRLTVDSLTGELMLSSQLIPDTYTIELIARDTVTLLDGRTNIQITVETLPTCPDDNGVNVKDTLLIKNLAENHIHEGVLSSVINDCSYNVININPSSAEFISINAETSQLDTVVFDRESDIFRDMEVPQIQVTLELRCPNETPLETFEPFTPIESVSSYIERFIAPQAPDGRWYSLSSSIPYSARTTILTIIIDDENDNVPQFVTPFADNQLYGYPDAQLATAIMPPYLLKVVATDRDAGINAQVSYSLVESNDFQIHSETGVITPLWNALQTTSEVLLTIQARDRNGAADGLVNTVNVKVKRLETKHITVITIEDEDIEEVDYVVEKIDEVTLVELKVLHSALISKEQTDRSSRADSKLNVLRIYAYAFDKNGELMEARTVQENLKDFNAELFRLTSATYEIDSQVNTATTDTVGLIIACAVLFALLIASVLATFSLWWFKVRPYEYRQMEDTGSVSSKQGLASGAASSNGTNSNGAPQSSPILKIDRFEVQKRDSMALRGTTTHDTSDSISSPQLLARRLADRLDVEASSPDISPTNSQTTTLEANPRKLTTGVRFNELVERIDIEVDPEVEQTVAEETDGERVAERL